MSFVAYGGWPRRLALASLVLLASACEMDPNAVSGRAGSDALTADHVVPTGLVCAPTGKHGEHAGAGIACATCHLCAGTVSFDPAVAGSNAAFDASAKTCSSVKCHVVPAGTFTYNTYDWGADAVVPVSVPYGGESRLPYWYAAPGQGCNACHGYPPRYNGVAYTWHSGVHGTGISNGNNCSLCHPDASGAYVYGGPPDYSSTSGGLIVSCPPGTYCAAPGTITNGSLHRNGTLEVTPSFSSKCMGCH